MQTSHTQCRSGYLLHGAELHDAFSDGDQSNGLQERWRRKTCVVSFGMPMSSLSLSLFFFLNQMGVLFSYGALLYLDTRLELGLPGPRMLQTNRTQADKKRSVH